MLWIGGLKLLRIAASEFLQQVDFMPKIQALIITIILSISFLDKKRPKLNMINIISNNIHESRIRFLINIIDRYIVINNNVFPCIILINLYIV